MDQILYYSDMFFQALKPCWAELVGAFLMASMTNLLSLRGSQKETFKLVSIAFYIIILKDLILVAFQLIPELKLNIELSQLTQQMTELIFISLITSCLITAAFRNSRVYFSSLALIVILTGLLAGFSIALSFSETWWTIGTYLSSVYMMIGLFITALSFFVNQSSRQNKAVRAIGNGFIVLTVCYGYQLFDLVANIQQIILLCYTITIVLSLAAQVQLLNLESEKLAYKLEAEKKSKHEIWEVSPFPVILSRLRDDKILYMNPVARQMFLLDPNEEIKYPFSDFFLNSERKNNLLDLLHQSPLIRSFEVEVHHPEKNNNFWIDLMTRISDMDEEVVLFTTFKDVTDQKRTTKILQEQASTDPLTGLYNRRQFEILAYQGLQTARRYDHPYSIAMLDIDFFKKINDTYGHEAGDTVLKELAKVLKTTLRKADVVARYGGEEFVIFLANTKPEQSKVAIEHVREAVEKMNPNAGGKTIHVTISAGISDCQSMNLATLIKHADEALYASKQNGRNQTTLYQSLKRYTKGDSSEKKSESDDRTENQPTSSQEEK